MVMSLKNYEKIGKYKYMYEEDEIHNCIKNYTVTKIAKD